MEDGIILSVGLSLAICIIVYMLLFNNKSLNVVFYLSIFLLVIGLLDVITPPNK